MENKINKLPKNEVEIEITLNKEDWEKEINNAYEKNKGKYNIEGFRKGKAPRKVIEKMYGENVFYEEALNECYPEAIDAAAKEAGVFIMEGLWSRFFPAWQEAKKILEEFKPDVVVGFGGYVTGPVLKMAVKMGIKTAIHEQNAFPGVANKALAKEVAEKCALPIAFCSAISQSSRLFPVKERAFVPTTEPSEIRYAVNVKLISILYV